MKGSANRSKKSHGKEKKSNSSNGKIRRNLSRYVGIFTRSQGNWGISSVGKRTDNWTLHQDGQKGEQIAPLESYKRGKSTIKGEIRKKTTPWRLPSAGSNNLE